MKENWTITRLLITIADNFREMPDTEAKTLELESVERIRPATNTTGNANYDKSEECTMKRRVLISVYDKRHIEEFASALAGMGYEIISTGGTLKKLREAQIEATAVEDLTGFQKCWTAV